MPPLSKRDLWNRCPCWSGFSTLVRLRMLLFLIRGQFLALLMHVEPRAFVIRLRNQVKLAPSVGVGFVGRKKCLRKR